MTRAQQAVLTVLAEEGRFLSAQDIHLRLRAAGNRTGLTSVYRALQALGESGAVDAVRTPTGEATYRACERHEHHHHLTCTSCGAATELDLPQVETLLQVAAHKHGFALDRHTVELTGRCRRCRMGQDSG